MADLTITEEQLDGMIAVSKDSLNRLAAHGMPEFDQDLKDMIAFLEKAKIAEPEHKHKRK